MTIMRRVFHIVFISLIFFLVSCLVVTQWIEALPIALIGGCIGWAFTEFKRETGKNQ